MFFSLFQQIFLIFLVCSLPLSEKRGFGAFLRAKNRRFSHRWDSTLLTMRGRAPAAKSTPLHPRNNLAPTRQAFPSRGRGTAERRWMRWSQSVEVCTNHINADYRRLHLITRYAGASPQGEAFACPHTPALTSEHSLFLISNFSFSTISCVWWKTKPQRAKKTSKNPHSLGFFT